jgi:hypothetical protein
MSQDPTGRCWERLAELQAWSDERAQARARVRICPATGNSVWESWQVERRLLTALPETLPEPFDVAITRQVGTDALVSFEGRQGSVAFRPRGSDGGGARVRP